MSHTLPTEDQELALNNANITSAPGTIPSNGRTHVKGVRFKLLLNLLATIFTLNIPTFHAAVSGISGRLGISAAISIWKAVRTLDSLLVATLVAVLLKADAPTSFWFFCSCSLLQAAIGLISSTALIIYFSAYPTSNIEHVEAVNQLDFLIWSIWDLFSVPSIWTSWSILTFTITLLINIAHPATFNGSVDGNSTNYSNLDSARALLLILICVSVVFFVLFLFYLRHLSFILASDR